MAEIRWPRYPRTASVDVARAWLVLQANLGLAANTLELPETSLLSLPPRITLPRTSAT